MADGEARAAIGDHKCDFDLIRVFPEAALRDASAIEVIPVSFAHCRLFVECAVWDASGRRDDRVWCGTLVASRRHVSGKV